MKKLIKSISLILAISAISVAILFCIFEIIENKFDTLKGEFYINKKDYEVIEMFDNHGGFHGDGHSLLVLDCSKNKEKILSIVDKWEKVPMSKNIYEMMYGGRLPLFNTIPKIENGYYKFYDRHPEASENRNSDEDLLARYSYNFSVAVYDVDNNIFYYFELDT